MVQEKIKIGMLEDILINLCSPVIYQRRSDTLTFWQIVEMKRHDYARLIRYVERHGTVSRRVRKIYGSTACGKLNIVASYVHRSW